MKSDKLKIAKILFWMALIGSYILAIIPLDHQPKITPFSDKGNHFIAFGVLTFLILYGYRVRYHIAFVLMLLYGIWIEITQLFIVNRYAEVMDVVADVVGIVGAMVIYWVYQKKLQIKSPT